MNARKILTRKIIMGATLVITASLVIALVAIPASAVNKAPSQSTGDGVLNSTVPLPTMINYQGYLTDSGGNPINDTLEMTFSIYKADIGGIPIWTETHPSVTVTNGLFNVLLGSVNLIKTSHLTGTSYLGIQVGADPEMTPRQQIVSVAYAVRADEANNADTLDNMNSNEFAKATHNHDSDYVNVAGDTMTGQLVLPANGLVAGNNQLVLIDGKVGIGTNSPGYYKLYVQGGSDRGIYASGSTYGVYGYNSDSGNYGRLGNGNEGVYGKHNASGNFGQIGTNLEGVYGEHNASGNYGRLGSSSYGVQGMHYLNSNYGRLGTSMYGVHGVSSSGRGVYGTTTTGYGVYGENESGNNYGILGTDNYGVYGVSIGGKGVYGTSYASFGVYGFSDYTVGVYGENGENGHTGALGGSWYGAYGKDGNSGSFGVVGYSAYGVFGHGTGYDFYADGPGNNYGPFTGAHEVKLADGFTQNIKPGLIVSVTGETQLRTEDGEMNYSSTLPTVQLADTPNDKKIAGVFVSESPLPDDHWYQASDGEHFGIINALGDGRVWVTDINGNIEAGDYITSSSIPGYGQLQDDDVLHSYTLGKATEAVDWSQVTETIEFNGQTYKAYAIAVFYTSG